ncbi:hypothetical protein NMY22_g3412 [Coprinellus aureogranulatus]|nr:hypothetical protein NMY22_g3412 [Coprinellus aureogranulatus]
MDARSGGHLKETIAVTHTDDVSDNECWSDNTSPQSYPSSNDPPRPQLEVLSRLHCAGNYKLGSGHPTTYLSAPIAEMRLFCDVDKERGMSALIDKDVTPQNRSEPEPDVDISAEVILIAACDQPVHHTDATFPKRKMSVRTAGTWQPGFGRNLETRDPTQMMYFSSCIFYIAREHHTSWYTLAYVRCLSFWSSKSRPYVRNGALLKGSIDLRAISLLCAAVRQGVDFQVRRKVELPHPGVKWISAFWSTNVSGDPARVTRAWKHAWAKRTWGHRGGDANMGTRQGSREDREWGFGLGALQAKAWARYGVLEVVNYSPGVVAIFEFRL